LSVRYKTKTANEKEIYSHLIECSANFKPPLDEKVNIQTYSKRIFDKSFTFEAWNEQVLVGLVAAYFTDSKNISAYITNVSVFKKYNGQGIATKLLNICINHARKNCFSEISLEVSKENQEAIYIYKKLGFIEFKSKESLLLMKLRLDKHL
jgi:ribosomal protein S18 acetylase RimI-like enzyme